MLVSNVEVDVEKIISKFGIRGKLNTSSHELLAECPWRSHRTGADKFYINVYTGLWQCKACPDKRGNIFQLIAILGGMNIGSASDYLIEHGNEINYEDLPDMIQEILNEHKQMPISHREAIYFKQESNFIIDNSLMLPSIWRDLNISDDAVKEFNLLFLPYTKYPYIIPIEINREYQYIIQRAYRLNTRPRYRYQYGFPRREILYGVEKIKANMSKVIVCEGALDAISIWSTLREYGTNEYGVVSTLGTSVSHQQIKLLQENCDEVIMFFDNDDAGRLGMQVAAKALYNVLVRSVDYSSLKYPGGDPRELDPKEQWFLIRNANLHGFEELNAKYSHDT